MNKQFTSAIPLFETFMPSIGMISSHNKIQKVLNIFQIVKIGYNITRNSNNLYELFAQGLVSHTINKKIYNPIRQKLYSSKLENKVSNISHLKNGYTWFNKTGQYKYIIVFHNADKAGPHLDIHFENGLSLIKRVKPNIYNKLKYNSNGELTNSSKELLISFFAEELDNHSRIPQNIDHNWNEAHYLWNKRENSGIDDGNYGAGDTRQLVLSGTTEVIKINDKSGKSTVMYMPEITGNNLSYIHQLYPGDNKKAPILIFGTTIKKAPKLEEKLHLKNIAEKEKFLNKINNGIILKKYDGASTIIVTDNDGSVPFSPRISKKSNERINYLSKVPEVGQIKTKDKWIVRGELLFLNKGKELKAHEIGGILNAHKVRDKDIYPIIRIYRVEKFRNKRLSDLPYDENLKYLTEFSKLNKNLFLLPEQISIDDFDNYKDIEGFVGIPENASISEGYKFKFNGDENDWQITNIDLKEGKTGRTAGVVWFKSLESDKVFKLGPGQLGNESFVRDIMNNPDTYKDQVFKVRSKVGHEGRASKLIMSHLDKGYA